MHFYTDTELFGWSKPQARPRSKTHSTVAPELFFADMKTGEFVVHIEHGIGMLKAPPRRIAYPDIVVPFSPPMEQFALPNADKIVAAARAMMTQGASHG